MSLELVVRDGPEGAEWVRMAIGMDVHRALMDWARRASASSISALWDDASNHVVRSWELEEFVADLDAILRAEGVGIDVCEFVTELRSVATEAHTFSRDLEFVAR